MEFLRHVFCYFDPDFPASPRPPDPRVQAAQHNSAIADGTTTHIGAFLHTPDGQVLLKLSDDEWIVRWWRGNEYVTSSNIPDPLSDTVPSQDIVDSLWGETTGRRQIRLGKWQHASQVPDVEDILSDPYSLPYTLDIHLRLVPHAAELMQLLRDPYGFPIHRVPVLKYLESEKGKTRGLVPLSGGLSIEQRAKITNWFKVNIANKVNIPDKEWLALPIHTHAMTLFLASDPGILVANDVVDTTDKDGEWRERLERAWEIQCSADAETIWKMVDVDKECLAGLEELMFENSLRAGMAGNYQWGLNVGDHQDAWDPYEGLPEVWNVGDREASDSERRVIGYGYIKVEKPQSTEILARSTQERPGPRKITRKRKFNEVGE